MRALCSIILLIFITSSLSFTSINNLQENKIIGVFKGITEDNNYQFIETSKNNEFLFYDKDEKIDISLYNDDFIGKTFYVYWQEKQIDVIDANGELTGDSKIVKIITTLKALQ